MHSKPEVTEGHCRLDPGRESYSELSNSKASRAEKRQVRPGVLAITQLFSERAAPMTLIRKDKRLGLTVEIFDDQAFGISNHIYVVLHNVVYHSLKYR